MNQSGERDLESGQSDDVNVNVGDDVNVDDEDVENRGITDEDVADMPPLESVPSTPIPHHYPESVVGVEGNTLRRRRRHRDRTHEVDEDEVLSRGAGGGRMGTSDTVSGVLSTEEEDDLVDDVADLTRVTRLSRADSFASTAELIPPAEEGSPSRGGGGRG